MKHIQLVAVIASIVLGGCTTTAPTASVASTSQERNVPLGTLFAKKASPTDPSSKVDMQSLENARTMNNNGLMNQK